MLGSLVLGSGCDRRQVAPTTRSETAESHQSVSAVGFPGLSDTKPRDLPGLHNVVAYHDNFLSGSAPEGDAGFDSLSALGVKTVISVDGAAPEVDRASARHLRYIHLPIGYNGFDDARRLELARAVRDAARAGLVYIHCHHGKHRSAGAAAAVAVALGWLTPDAATARMRVSGTGENYTGLYRCVAVAKPIDAKALDAVEADFPTVNQPQGWVKTMVEVDAVFDRLKAIESAGWTTPKDHPDLVPVAEAGRLADLFRMLDTPGSSNARPTACIDLLRGAQRHAQTLEDLLSATPKASNEALGRQVQAVAESCKACHGRFRD